MTHTTSEALALHGGPKVRTTPWPPRRLFGEEEKLAAIALFDRCIEQGEAFSYHGEEEEAYCREFVNLLGGVGYADGVNSGSAAVYVALRSLEIEPFTEVIVPTITDAGGCMPVALINCIPVPADCEPGSYNIGPSQIEARITERTSAIIVAHIAGMPADMDPIMTLARSHNIPVIEDCAQAHAAVYKGRCVGTIGDVAAFSTMSGKHHATGGQGGVVYTQDEARYWRIRCAADRGKPFNLDTHGNVTASLNLNLDDLSAAIGRVQLKKLPAMIAARRRVALGVAQGCAKLATVDFITDPPGCQNVFWFMCFQLDLRRLSIDRTTFVKALSAEGIPARAGYADGAIPTDMPWYTNREVFGTSGYPWTSPAYQGDASQQYPTPNIRATETGMCQLGIHENLGAQEIVDIIAAFEKVEAAFLR
jgi:perosamine synthetase